MFVSYCSRTRPLEWAEEDLQELGEGRAPEPGITGDSPTTSGDFSRLLAWAIPLVATITGAAIFIRRVKRRPGRR